jgi:hypothetical protein
MEPSRRRRQLHQIEESHGLMILISQLAKSPSFRVATAALRERAMAAIWASNSPMARPNPHRVAAMSANAFAARLSNGRMRPCVGNDCDREFANSEAHFAVVDTKMAQYAAPLPPRTTSSGRHATSYAKVLRRWRSLRAKNSKTLLRATTMGLGQNPAPPLWRQAPPTRSDNQRLPC